MASLKEITFLLKQKPVFDAVLVPEVAVTQLLSDPDEEHPEREEPEVYYLYPYKTKYEAAKEIKESFDKVTLPDIITIKCTRLKKEVVPQWFDLVKKYWHDNNYVRDRLIDLQTIFFAQK